MQHASRLDLSCYEDPATYDKLERARVQGTDRIVVIQSAGRWVQELHYHCQLGREHLLLSPWLLFALIACLVPAFLGETHFAFLGYSLNFQQTPARRELEYLRMAGSSKEGVKEVKLCWARPVPDGEILKSQALCRVRRWAWRSASCCSDRFCPCSARSATTEPMPLSSTTRCKAGSASVR